MAHIHICVIIGNTHANKKLGLNVGGVANQMLRLLRSYEKIENIKISLITKYSEYIPLSNRFKIYIIRKYRNFFLNSLYFLFKSPLKVIKIHKKTPINVINIHNCTYFYIFIIFISSILKIPILMKVPLDFTSFIKDTAMQKENKIRTRILNYSWDKLFRKLIIKKINFIRAINKKIYNDLINLKYPKECILEIPNGIESSIFNGLQKKTRDVIHYGYVGRLVQLKNVRYLLYVFKEYFSKYPSDKLFIYGIGPEVEWISRFIIKNKLNANVIICGFEKNKKEIYSNLDVLIDPSFAQGISNANLEAMSSNTFVISSNVIGNQDLIKHKITGLLFNPYRKQDLLEQLIFYKQNPVKIREIIQNAKIEIMNNYDVDIITSKIYKYLQSKLSPFKC